MDTDKRNAIIDKRIALIKQSEYFFEFEEETKSLNNITYISTKVSGKAQIKSKPIVSSPYSHKTYIAIMVEHMINQSLQPNNDNYILLTVGDIQIQDTCPINNRITALLNPDTFKLLIQEGGNSILPFIQINIQQKGQAVSSFFASSLDFKKDPIFLNAVREILLEQGVIVSLNEIQLDPVWHLEQWKMLGY